MTFIIAEIGQAHDGSLGILHSYIEALSRSGADAIKFQTHIAEAESSKEDKFRVNFSYEDETRYDYWERMSFNINQWKQIKNHCDDVGLEFISTPFSNMAVDLLEELNVKRYKVGSGDTSNLLLLEKISKTSKPIILSTGMSSFQEIKKSIDFSSSRGIHTSILQCTTQYPSKPENVGLNVIQEMKNIFNIPIGFSDHSGEIYAPLAAVAKGAQIIEVHITFHKEMFGPDTSSSLTIEKFEELVLGIRYLDKAEKNALDKNDINGFKSLKKMFGKTLSVNKDLQKGSVLNFLDLEHKKPSGMGISAEDYKQYLGQKLIRDKKKWDFLTLDDFNEK